MLQKEIISGNSWQFVLRCASNKFSFNMNAHEFATNFFINYFLFMR